MKHKREAHALADPEQKVEARQRVSDKRNVLEADDRFLDEEIEFTKTVTPGKGKAVQQQIENVVISNVK